MNGAKKTHIVYEVNLNFNIAQKYLGNAERKRTYKDMKMDFSSLLTKEKFSRKWLKNLNFK